jgi:aquaporin NIP
LTVEFLGTFILVFMGTGAIIVQTLTGALGHSGVALTFGFVVVALIYAFGHISGAHFNPAVTIGFSLIGEFDRKEALYYIGVQLLGALLASGVLLFIFLEEFSQISEVAYLGATLPRGSVMQSFVLEFILTFVLMLIICASAVHGRAIKSFAGLAIGLTVGLEAMFAGPICGASMNPARSIAPALVSGNISSLWIYIIATIIGAIVGAIVFEKFLKCKNKEECCLS